MFVTGYINYPRLPYLLAHYGDNILLAVIRPTACKTQCVDALSTPENYERTKIDPIQ